MAKVPLKLVLVLALAGCLGVLVTVTLEVRTLENSGLGGEQEAFGELAGLMRKENRLVRLELQRGESVAAFGLRSNGWWWTLEPMRGMADQAWVQSWEHLISAPRWTRILKAEEWNPVGIFEEVEMRWWGMRGQGKVRYLRLAAHPNHAYLELEDGRAIKVEVERPPQWPKQASHFRSRRIWPFQSEAVKELTLERPGLKKTWQRKGDQWVSVGGPGSARWKTFFENWPHMIWERSLEKVERKGPPLGEFKVTFEEGGASLLQMSLEPIHGPVAQYSGDPVGMVLSQETLDLLLVRP